MISASAYDLYFNPQQFRREAVGDKTLEAAQKKRDRADRSTALTFLLIGVGYALTILAVVQR